MIRNINTGAISKSAKAKLNKMMFETVLSALTRQMAMQTRQFPKQVARKTKIWKTISRVSNSVIFAVFRAFLSPSDFVRLIMKIPSN